MGELDWWWCNYTILRHICGVVKNETPVEELHDSHCYDTITFHTPILPPNTNQARKFLITFDHERTTIEGRP